MRTKTFLLIIFVLAFLTDGIAQKEWSNWYLNNNTLLTFKNGTAELKKNYINPIPPPENFLHYYRRGRGGVSYSDPATGEMKFIISDRWGFNKNFQMFPSETIIRSCPDKNSYHIIPFQSNPDKFYVLQFQSAVADLRASETGLQVRCPNAVGLAYSIVDLSLDGGLGDFSVANQGIAGGLTEQMTIVRHANGKDVWAIVHPYNTATFQAFLISDAGIAPAISTSIGPMINQGSASASGKLQASHNGKLLAGTVGLYDGRTPAIQLFDFDNATGKLSNLRQFPFGDFMTEIQFSPDDSKLYGLGYESLYQFDLDAPNIGASMTRVVNQPNGLMYDMQLAPDGKIYVTKSRGPYVEGYGNEYIGIIQCPNLPKYACNFVADGIPAIAGAFPSIINDFIVDTKAPALTTLDLGKDTSVCFGKFAINAPEGWESYRWNTGETTRQITVTEPGIYYVLSGNTGFSCPSGYGYITLSDAAEKLDLGPDLLLCPRDFPRIQIPESFTNVLWENGSRTSDSLIRQPTTAIVKALDRNGCVTKDTITVSFKYYPQTNFSGDTSLCEGETMLLQLEPRGIFGQPGVFLWQDGSSKSQFTVTKPGLYWGQATFENCTLRDSIYVSYIDPASVSLGADTTLCDGDSLILRLPPGNSYKWSTGELTSSIVVKDAGTYSVEVYNGVCTVSTSIKVSVHAKPEISLGQDTAICTGQQFTLRPKTGQQNYLWQDGSTADSLAVDQAGWYWAEVQKNGCVARDSVYVIYKPLPFISLGNDTTICEKQVVRLHVAHPSVASALWQDGSGDFTYSVAEAGIYHATVTGRNGCQNSDSITVAVTPLPKFSLGNDTTLCETKSLTLTIGPVAGTYLWYDLKGGRERLVSRAGVYWLEVTDRNCSRRDSITVAYKPMPAVFLGNDTALCAGKVLLLDASFPGATYRWNDLSTMPVLPVSRPGRYVVDVNVENCIATASIAVRFLKKPEFTLGADMGICPGQTILLRPSVPGATYLWQNGSSAPEQLVTTPGIYQVTATNDCGMGTGEIHISEGVCDLYLPNAFSPNGDGLNDLFRIANPGFISEFEMIIYNRFGQVIFKTNDPKSGWDGSFNSEPQPVGTYAWVVRLTNLHGEQKSAKGMVTLLR